MIILHFVIIVLASLATLVTLYVFVLAVIGCFTNQNLWLPLGKRRNLFAVVVPAHDEELHIERTILSLRRLDYPVSRFRIVVIADNCSDGTAQKAKDLGVQVMERNSPDQRGKGFALAFAIPQLLEDEFDAIVVVDADTIVASNLLDAFDRRLSAGQHVLQAVYGVANPDASPLTYLQYLGNFMENYLFHLPKSRLGLPVILRGNGMCFSADVLRTNPWTAHSVVEDTEYGLVLLLAGIPVQFVFETSVYAEFPSSIEQLHTQRIRWASGNGSLLKKYAIPLLWQGITQKNKVFADAGWSLLVSSKPLVMLAVVLPATMALVVDGTSGVLFLWMCAVACCQIAYVGLGVIFAGISSARLRNLAHLPYLVAHMTRYAVMGLFGYRKDLWTRTKRT